MVIDSTNTNASREIAFINESMTGPPAARLIERSGILEKQSSVDVFDNATGTGILSLQLLGKTTLHEITAGDIDEQYLSIARERGINAVYADQQGTARGPFDYVFNSFGIFFAKDAAVLADTLRMLRPGGFAGFTSWQKFTWWDEILVPALNELGAPALPSPAQMFAEWSQASLTEAKLRAAGFGEVNTEVLAFSPDVTGEDLARACAHLAKAVAIRAWTAEDQQLYVPQIEGAMLGHLRKHFAESRWTGEMKALLTWGSKKEL